MLCKGSAREKRRVLEPYPTLSDMPASEIPHMGNTVSAGGHSHLM